MANNVEIVLTKYRTGKKQVVKYDKATGQCWIETTTGNVTTIEKRFEVE